MAKSQPGDEDLSEEGATVVAHPEAPKNYESFYERSKPGDDFTEEDFASPAFRKSLLDHLRRLTSENKELKRYREDFHDRDKRVEVLKARVAPADELTIVSNFTLAVGGLVAGVGVSQVIGGIWGIGGAILALGLILMFTPLLARKIVK